MEFDDEDKSLDYNLLYFLSIIRGRNLLKQGYTVLPAELPKLYKRNNIPLHDNIAGSDYLTN